MTAIRLVFDKIRDGDSLTGDDIVVLVLVAAMLASSAHLLTMLATRWGDRHIAIKSFAASLLVHGVCLLGLEVFDPLQFRSNIVQAEVVMPVQTRTEILLESDDQVPLPEAGNTSAPDAPSQPDVDLERTPPSARNLDEPDDPSREPENLDAIQATLPDATELLEFPETQSTVPVEHGEQGPVEVAAPDPASEHETIHDQNTADVHVVEIERMLPAPGDAVPQLDPVDRRTTAAKTDRVRPQPNFDEATLPVAASERSNPVRLKPIEPEDDLKSRATPLPGEESVDMAGVETLRQPQRTLPARSFDRRRPRPERSRPSRSQTPRPSRIHSNSPRTPIPLSDSYDEVRVGLAAPLNSDDLQSSASLVELDTSRIQRQDQQPSAYRLRSREYRQDAVRKFGGTERSEATVELSLQWFASMQAADGHWDASDSGAGLVENDPLRKRDEQKFVGHDADSGITALVTLSFLGAGYTHENGRYALQVDKALDWLISQQDEDGGLAGSADYYSRMYCHGMATYALAEALGMQSSVVMGPMFDPQLVATGPAAAEAVGSLAAASVGVPPIISGSVWSASSSTLADVKAWNSRRIDDLRLRSALMKAIRFTLRWQHKEGSWRYSPGKRGDLSLFGWQLMSLKSAEIAGINIHTRIRERMENFIEEARMGEDGGLFAYRKDDEDPTPAMTAEALFCQQMLGQPRESASNQESVAYLLDHLPRLSELNLYYWYYGTLSMYQHGGDAWQQWNAAVRDTLINEQVTDGPLAGSWDPNGPWGRYGGRLYSTALSTLTLEVYYRLLPLYRMGDESRAAQDSSTTGSRRKIFDR